MGIEWEWKWGCPLQGLFPVNIDPDKSRQELETARVSTQWNIYIFCVLCPLVDGTTKLCSGKRRRICSVTVKQHAGLLEMRKWAGSFRHALLHLLKSEAGGRAHVHISLIHSIYCWIKIWNVRKVGTLKRLHEDVWREEIAAGKKRLKLKVNELQWNVRSRS